MQRGRLSLTSQGAPGSNANRKVQANALAVFVQDKMTYGKWSVTPGVRYEGISFSYSDYGKNDPHKSGVALKRNYSDVSVIIPGIGAQYQVSKTIN
jgi:Fe(3+) dicitrate transport protein